MNRVCSIFAQLLQLFPREKFQQAVKKHKAERHARGFTCWGQFVAMLFCQLGAARSLREICNGLAASEGKLRHLGIPNAPSRSTLAYANEHRPAKLYEDLFYTALKRFRDEEGLGLRKKKFRFKNKLLSLDSTTISLCLELFPWAKFRRAKGGIKLHTLLEIHSAIPVFIAITEALLHDVNLLDVVLPEPGSFIVIDRKSVV